jgi:hypothetical protein
MHLVIPYAAPVSDAGRDLLRSLALPALAALLARWPAQQLLGDDGTLSPPHEAALAQALRWPGEDGAWPLAAWRAQRDGLAPGAQPLALLSPVHQQVGADQVRLLPPEALALTEPESRALWAAAQPLVAQDGGALLWGTPQRWYLQHPALPGTPLPALDRVAGHNLLPWRALYREPAPLRRLLNEVQMLWHAHPVNQQRDAAGQLVANALWLSGCGAGGPAHDDPALVLDERLAAPAQAEDLPAWAAAWQALDAQVLHPLLPAAPGTRLTLCGARGRLALSAPAAGWWPRLRARWQAPAVPAVHLEPL